MSTMIRLEVDVPSETRSGAVESDDAFIKSILAPRRRFNRRAFSETPSVVVREEPTKSTSSAPSLTTSCGPKDTTGICERSVNTTQRTTIPVVLGVVLPLTVALIIFVVLHRRYVKNLRKEDAEDKFKSLDFGVGGKGTKEDRKSVEMTMNETKDVLRKDRGLSMDMHMNTPYLLPPALNQSRESLRSLSKSLHDNDDKYNNTDFIPDDGSIRPPSSVRHYGDESSSYTGSSKRKFDAESTKTLVRHAQASPLSAPPTRRVSLEHNIKDVRSLPPAALDTTLPVPPHSLLSPSSSNSNRNSYMSTMSGASASRASRTDNAHLGPIASSRATEQSRNELEMIHAIGHPMNGHISEEHIPMVPVIHEPPQTTTTTDFEQNFQLPELDNNQPRPDNKALPVTGLTPERPDSSIPPVRGLGMLRPESHYSEDNTSEPDRPQSHFEFRREPRLPQLSICDTDAVKQANKRQAASHHESEPTSQLSTPSLDHNASGSLQLPSQANSTLSSPKIDERISIYEDYYDEDEMFSSGDYLGALGYDPRRLSMGVRPLPPDDPSENPEQRANRIRSFYKEYFEDTKPNAGHGSVAYFDGSESYYNDGHSSRGYYDRSGYSTPRGTSQTRRPGQHRATVSNGSYMSGSRIASGMSSQYGFAPRMPKKNLPPPKPLSLLPTPHMLKEDDAIFMAHEFAPPNLAKIQRSGTPDSLRGGKRAYTPSMRSHVPLASAFDDITVIPSPHALGNESTYTSLDFAPPPRIRGRESRANSETGSIRSNRSGISAIHHQNIRSGAYRISRIPKEVAGSKNELAQALKPKWDMNR